jgi:hypothetical protein
MTLRVHETSEIRDGTFEGNDDDEFRQRIEKETLEKILNEARNEDQHSLRQRAVDNVIIIDEQIDKKPRYMRKTVEAQNKLTRKEHPQFHFQKLNINQINFGQ